VKEWSVATNQMRREAAKRKLARQQERRLQQAKRRRQIAVITSAVVVVVVVVGVVLLTTLGKGGDTSAAAAAPSDAATPTSAAAAALPPGSCAYPAEGTAAKADTPPPTTGVPTTGDTKVALATSAGPIGLTLNAAKAPCTVNSFLSLTRQKYFDGTSCHRLTTGDGLKVLQCGDPTGTGSGGPGYTIADEPPTGLAAAANGTVVYPRGTVAMAKTSAPNSGGSQFFLVYADSTLPPDYTVFGTIDAPGLATLDAIAKGGSNNANGPGDGAPNTKVTITTATVG
jgi:peptidyl-prolyl cis-trans isomerase B (cyclophilin B)